MTTDENGFARMHFLKDKSVSVRMNQWFYSPDHDQLCQVLESQTLWGQTTCRVWLPGRDSVVRIPVSRLSLLEDSGTCTDDGIAYVAAAARVADALNQDMLLSPIESSVIPLPHQIRALSRAISGDRVRYLLADEVGLGKTIEAGLILRELKLRGLVKRALVVAPKGLLTQWVAEMRTHFNEDFRLLIPLAIFRPIDVSPKRTTSGRAIRRWSVPWILSSHWKVVADGRVSRWPSITRNGSRT